jgi:dTMP kinase
MERGKFISIEGTEGAGKSTALKYIKNYLVNQNIDVVWTREPGGTEIAEDIRTLILHSGIAEKMAAETELMLMFAARNQHVANLIIPSLNAGKWVVSDRFVDASYAYQGGGRKIDNSYIETLDKWIVQGMYPDLTLLLDISPELGFERAAQRGIEKDRIESEEMQFFTRVREAYLARAKQYPERMKVIDASVPLFAVEQQISTALDEFRARLK